jgi:Ser/Thr protein kinase RdoA (MazF antagonist)
MTNDTVIRCQTTGQAYIVKIFRDSTAARNEIEWTRHADRLGIGPHVYYADFDTKTLLTDLAPGASFNPAKIQKPIILQNIASYLLKLHTSHPSFTPNARDLFSSMEEKYNQLSTEGELKHVLVTSWHYLLSIKKDIDAMHSHLVPCHNDLNPLNIFVDSNNVTFIDWGDASIGNRYYDILVFLVLNNISPENEQLFLQAYDQQLIQPTWQHYLTLLRQCVHFDFALNLLLGVQEQQKALLHRVQIDETQPLSHYLERMANKLDFDAPSLYHMALASLHAISAIQKKSYK